MNGSDGKTFMKILTMMGMCVLYRRDSLCWDVLGGLGWQSDDGDGFLLSD